jgi:DNA invertase Pin-like site-specific DNA recombinase
MNEYVIAKYIRLSMDDAVTDSLSIPNQHSLLDRLIDEMEIPNATVIDFVDNGYTGTNMERPALQEMLELASGGRINCIVVKDFSRFSRNITESGYYIEKIFPLYRIRFISLSDRYDSNDYKDDIGGIDVSFRFLMHEYYSQDLSKKVTSAMRTKMLNGENIVAKAVYGYRKSDEGKWEPEEESAAVVRRIFQMALDGIPPTMIKDRLCESGIPTQNEHQELKRGKDIKPNCLWKTKSVRHILSNEQYAGSYVSGKQKQMAIGSHSKNWTDKNEWIVIPDSHPPIINKNDFERVQQLLESRLKHNRTAKPVDKTWQEDNRHHKERLISGDRIVAVAIYGYIKTPDGNLAIDPQAADVVRKMFELAIQGLSSAQIAKEFTAAGYPTPREYFNLSKGRDVKPSCKWSATFIRAMIKNIQYTGTYVAGKILVDHNTGKKYHTAQEDWIVIPNKHPVIISKDVFEETQKVIASNRVKRKNMMPKDYLLRSKVKCGYCGYSLSYDPVDTPVFRCYHTDANPTADCYKMKVVVHELDEAIMETIRIHAEVVLNTAELSSLQKASENIRQISELKKQVAQLTEQRQGIYEQYIIGKIDRDSYQSLKAAITDRLSEFNTQLARHRQSERDMVSGKKSAAIAKTVLNNTFEPKEIIDALIEKILVFPDDELEIVWKVKEFWVA